MAEEGATAKKRAVGLVVLTDIPGMGRVAILQKRGEFNHEKMGPESWPGACQVTAHGGVENDEELETAIRRELQEELGDIVGKYFWLGKLKEIARLETEVKLVVTYAALAPASGNILRVISLGASSGGLRLLPEDEVDSIQDLRQFDKNDGVTDRRTTAMFPDEKEAVRKAFEAFRDQ